MQRYDVAIIGGGLTGCAAAYYLSQGGARVILLERDDMNQGASGRNAGSLHFQLEHREVAHAHAFSQGLEHRVELSRLAIEHWRGLEAELGENLELSMRGGLMLAGTDPELALLRRKSDMERQHGLSSELLDRDEVRRLVPYVGESVRAAAFCPDEGHCNPRLVAPAFAKRALAKGVRLLTRTCVTSLRRGRDGWCVQSAPTTEENASVVTEPETIVAEAILNAAGAAAGQIAALANYHLPIFPVGLLMSVTEKVAPLLPYLVQHVGKRISMKQTHSGNFLLGGGWSVRMRPQFAPGAPPMDTIVRNLQVATEIMPPLVDVHVIRTWSGVTGVTADQLPLIGEISHSKGLFVAAGGSGFTFGPLYARLISEQMLTGRMSANALAYSPARFDHINMFMG